MSSGERRKISPEEIQQVQNGIERCLRSYMNQKEVMDLLFIRDKIERRFTELVWQKLEEENQEFFRAYYLRLMVKDQIMEFNKLLSDQADLMSRLGQAGIASIAMSNGSHVSTMHQNSAGRTLRPENMRLPLSAAIPNAFSPTGPSMHSSMQTSLDMSSRSRNLDVAGNMLLTPSSNRGTVQALGGGMIKPEPGYAGSLPFEFGAHNNLVEHRAVLGDASVSSFSSVESNSQPINEALLEPDPASFGYLGHISQTFGLADMAPDFSNGTGVSLAHTPDFSNGTGVSLSHTPDFSNGNGVSLSHTPDFSNGTGVSLSHTPDFSNGTDILESYTRSSFLAPDPGHFLDPHGRSENQGDVARSNSATENLRFQDLGEE